MQPAASFGGALTPHLPCWIWDIFLPHDLQHIATSGDKLRPVAVALHHVGTCGKSKHVGNQWEHLIRPSGKGQRSTTSVCKSWAWHLAPQHPPAKCTKMTHIYTSLHIHIKHHQASSSYMCSITHHYNSLYTLRGLCVTSILLCLSPHTADFAPNPRPFAAENMALGEDCVMSRPCSFHPPPQDSGLGHPPSWLWCCQPTVENRGNQHRSASLNINMPEAWKYVKVKQGNHQQSRFQTLLCGGLIYSTQTGTNPSRIRHAQGMHKAWACIAKLGLVLNSNALAARLHGILCLRLLSSPEMTKLSQLSS